jgi:hypothetical protein
MKIPKEVEGLMGVILIILVPISLGFASFGYIGDKYQEEQDSREKVAKQGYEKELAVWKRITSDPCLGPFEKEVWSPNYGRSMVRFGAVYGPYSKPSSEDLRLKAYSDRVELYDGQGSEAKLLGTKYNSDSKFCQDQEKKR